MPAKNHYSNRNKRGHGSAGHGDRHSLTAIPAPYNFVPVASWVHRPSWGRQVSWDLPFEDGLSGEIPFTLVADTPMLVGGAQTKASSQQPGDVRPFETPDGYAIPGSSLRGMLRSVLEIAAFGRLSKVDDARYGLRDISGPASAVYTNKVKQVKTGFLERSKDGGRILTPCRKAWLEHRGLEDWLKAPSPIFRTRTNVAEKYRKWQDVTRRAGVDEHTIKFDLDGDTAIALGEGGHAGVPVFTGQISDSTKPNGKKRDFLFYDPMPGKDIEVSDRDWRDFLFIHGDEDGKPDQSWPGHWRAIFNRGVRIPVFYIDDGIDGDGQQRLRLGLAYMPKLAWDFSVHDLIGHTNTEHLNTPEQGGDYDLADLLFGSLGDSPERHLKGRVSCGLAMAQGKPRPGSPQTTILNGPKPTYFPNYLQQKTDRSTGKLDSREYATCIETDDNKRPKLRGFKRYPVRADAKVQPLSAQQQQTKKVQVRLHPLPAGTRFQGSLLFHNLRPMELGALVWVLSWGNDPELRHALGMGKPFGFGQCHIEVDWSAGHARANKDLGRVTAIDPERYCREFTDHMQAAWKTAKQPEHWEQCPQLANLRAMADPARAGRFKPGLRHMVLDSKRRINEFQEAKQERPPLVLMDYVTATGGKPTAPIPTGSKTWANARLVLDPGRGQVHAESSDGKKTAPLNRAQTSQLQQQLDPTLNTRLKKKKFIKDVSVTVEIKGNLITLSKLA